VYAGADPETRRQRWLTKTVHGSARYARGQLQEFVAEAAEPGSRAGTLSDLLEHWFEVASPRWAASATGHTRSIIECYLKPHLGRPPVNKITPEDIDDFYAYLMRSGGQRHQPLSPGSVARVHGALHRAFA
jgi:Phage integrase, N-terminal SAM-like domain